MALDDILSRSIEREKENTVQEGLTAERVHNDLPGLRRLISFWRCYPDLFVDYLCTLNPENTFHFYFYQRVYMRAVARHKYIYATFPRAYSKSFLAVLGLMVRSILYPGSHLFMVSAGKNQSASILSSKIQELCRLIPALYNEILWDTRGTDAKTINTKDTVIYTFRNGSTIENVAASEKTRGRRFTAGVMEEAATLDQTMLQEVIIPTTNVKRSVNGQIDPEDRMNQQQLYINFFGQKVIKYCW